MGMGTGSEDDDWGKDVSPYDSIDPAIIRLQSIKVAIVQACNRIENSGGNAKIINDAVAEIRREAGKI